MMMETSIFQVIWGAQAENEAARTLNDRDPFSVLSQRIQRALSTAYTTPRVRAIQVTRAERTIDGLICEGFSISVEVVIGQRPDSASDEQELKCKMEALLSVALLDLLCPVHVDLVTLTDD